MKSDNKLQEAFIYMGLFYNKVLLVNLKDDTFSVIKVDDDELSGIYCDMTFTQWVNDFALSPHCNKVDKVKFLEFNSPDRLRALTRPAVLRYRKLIDNNYHEVLEEIIPIGSDKIYLYVKDLTKMLGEDSQQ